MFLLSLGLTQPTGFLEYRNLQEQYEQCRIEDHDITPLDFIFEHLLNLESIVNLIEREHEYVGGDYPHQPFQASESVSQVLLALPNTLQFDICKNQHFFDEKISHPIRKMAIRLAHFCADIFRPPMLS